MVERAPQLGDDGVARGRRWLRPRQWATHAFVLGLPAPALASSASRASRADAVGLHPGPAGRDRVIAPRVTEAQSPQGSLQLDQRRSGLTCDSQVGPEVPDRDAAVQGVRARAVPPGSRGRAGGGRATTAPGCRRRAPRRPRRSRGPGRARRSSDAGPRSLLPPPSTGTPGSAHSSASRARAANPASLPAPRWAKITGRSALANSSAVRASRAGSRAGRGRGHGRQRLQGGRRARLAQDLSWKAQVHRTLGRGVGDGEGPVEQGGHLLGEAQLVVPLARLPHEGVLVAHLLAPTDGHGSGPEAVLLDGGRAPRHHEHRHVVGGGVDGTDRPVGQARRWCAGSPPASVRWRGSSRGPCS